MNVKRATFIGVGALVIGALSVVKTPLAGQQDAPVASDQFDQVRAALGFKWSPVPIRKHDRAVHVLVGVGSYLVNAVAACSDCHTFPAYLPGGDPFKGEPTKVNTQRFLAGGRKFGPIVVSRNITPDENGLPGGLTFRQFSKVMRTGVDLENKHPAIGPLLQNMPWPAFRQMDDYDLAAIYVYLSHIPSIAGD